MEINGIDLDDTEAVEELDGDVLLELVYELRNILAEGANHMSDCAHQWKRKTMTAEEAANDPWRCFGYLVLEPDGSYDGPDVQAWHNTQHHGGAECALCGERFCVECDRKRWHDIAIADHAARHGERA